MFLPVLVKARDRARYARWQAFTHSLQTDPDVCLYYTLEGDRGSSTVTNNAYSSQAQTDAPRLNGQLSYWTGSAVVKAASGSAILTQYWAQDGRFRGKPSLTFTPASFDLLVFPSQLQMVANLLGTTQQISIAVWVAGSVKANTAVFYWPTVKGYQYPAVAIHVPWSDGNIYFDAGTTNGAAEQVKCTPPQNTKWQFWVLPKAAVPAGQFTSTKMAPKCP